MPRRIVGIGEWQCGCTAAVYLSVPICTYEWESGLDRAWRAGQGIIRMVRVSTREWKGKMI